MNSIFSAVLGVSGGENTGALSEVEKLFSVALRESQQFSPPVKAIGFFLKKKGAAVQFYFV